MALASIVGTYQGDAEAIALDVKATFDSFLARINSVTNEQMSTNAISTDKVIDAAIVLAKIADAAFTANTSGRAKFANDFITRVLQDNPAKGAGAYVLYQHVLATEANGGTSTTNTWNTRQLNAVTDFESIGAGAPSSGVFILPAGTYNCKIYDLVDTASGHLCRLRNTTAASTLVVGTTGNASGNSMGVSIAAGQFTVTAGQDLEVQHWVETGLSTFGMGRGVTGGVNGQSSIFSNAEFWKVD